MLNKQPFYKHIQNIRTQVMCTLSISGATCKKVVQILRRKANKKSREPSFIDFME